jgi:tetratricopeptide (TPR) repeat protein
MNLFLSYALFQLGQFAQAEESFREVFEMRKSFFGDGAETVIAGKNLMTCLAQLGRYKDAEEVGQVILPMAKAIYGENHIKTHELQSEINLMASGALGDPALSEEEELAAALSASLNEEETMAMEEMRMIEEAIAASLAEDERRKMAGEVPDSLSKPADWPDIPDEEDDYQTMPEEVD